MLLINLIIVYSFTGNPKITNVLGLFWWKTKMAYNWISTSDSYCKIIEIWKIPMPLMEVKISKTFFLSLMLLLISVGTIECAQENRSLGNAILESGCTDEGNACFTEDTCCPGLVCKWYTVGSGTCVKNVFWLLFWTSSCHYTFRNDFLFCTFGYVYERYLKKLFAIFRNSVSQDFQFSLQC